MQRDNRSRIGRALLTTGLACAMAMIPGMSASAANDDHAASGWRVGLVKQAYDAGQRYLDVQAATDDGYVLATGCVSGENGAMGVHYIKPALLGDGQVDPRQPEALVYEPDRHGSMRLVAVEYMTDVAAWHARHGSAPVLSGQSMDLMGEPNRFAVPATYELHVWAFRDNPNGMFAGFNPKVTCKHYNPGPSA